jgi:hypothetical protein
MAEWLMRLAYIQRLRESGREFNSLSSYQQGTSMKNKKVYTKGLLRGFRNLTLKEARDAGKEAGRALKRM